MQRQDSRASESATETTTHHKSETASLMAEPTGHFQESQMPARNLADFNADKGEMATAANEQLDRPQVSSAAMSTSTSTPTQGGNIDCSRVQPIDAMKQFWDSSFCNPTGYSDAAEMVKLAPHTTTWAAPVSSAAPRDGLAFPTNTAMFSQTTAPYSGTYPSSAAPGRASAVYMPQFASTQFANNAPNAAALTSTQIAARQVISRDLPVFSGKPEEWLLFISNYEQSSQRCGFTNEENLIRLQRCLRGAALDAVRGKLMVPAMVPYAIGTLRMLYGRSEIVHAALQRKLRGEPAIKLNNLDSLIRLALAVQNYCATMLAVNLQDYLNDPVLLSELVAKLPSDLKLDWGKHRLSSGGANLATFDNWLFNKAMCASMVTSYEHQYSDSSKGNGQRATKERVLVHNVVDCQRSKEYSCPQCKEQHNLSNCKEFRAMPTKARLELVRSKRLCFCCLQQHLVRNCHAKKQCGVDACTLRHHVLLHSAATDYSNAEPMLSKRNSSSEEKNKSAVLFHGGPTTAALFRYVPVTLYGKTQNVNTYALIDEAAGCTLIEHSLANMLELEGPEEQLCLKWTSDLTQTETSSRSVCVNISARRQPARRYLLKGVRTVASLDLPVQTIDEQLLRAREHLKSVPIELYSNVKAQLIIGLDNIKMTVPLEMREGDSDDVIAARCRLGWSVYGRHGSEDAMPPRVLHICQCNDTYGTRKLDEAMKAYFSLESIGVNVSDKPLRSKEDERALQIMKATTRYLTSDRRWETGLLWRFDKFELPDSYSMALKRLKCLEAKMMKNPNLRTFMLDTVQSYREKGYIRKLEKVGSVGDAHSWFLPIFTVTNANKKKTRLVWDAAAKVNEVSLNDTLLKGPDMLASLLGILIRFRERPIAVSGDIREMFHQVVVRAKDQTAQKFLWRDGDASRPPDMYVMQRMTFGASCSPALANYVLNRNAERFNLEQPEAVQLIRRNTFVDDWLQSIDNEDQMVQLATTVKQIHASGGFEMRQWSSNSKRVLQALNDKEETSARYIGSPFELQEKVLGMWWLPGKDVLTYMVKAELINNATSAYITKRRVLSVVMSIFDPLGLLGFFNIRAKIILQNIWRSGVSWDEPLKADDEDDWLQWQRMLPQLSELRIPRCLQGVSCAKTLQLHVFVDASLDAYAAVAYLRADLGSEIYCTLVASKTRVAPLKPISVPRMELMAAVLGLRLAKCIESEVSVRIDQRIFWTDARDVLYWIRSDARKFPQFVALRVGEILEGSEVDSWRWVPSVRNVADEGTKWTRKPEIDDSKRWFTGPEFLLLDESQWPHMDATTISSSSVLYHVEYNATHVSTLACIMPDPHRFSKLERLRVAQKRVLMYLHTIAKKSCGVLLRGLLQLKLDAEMDVVFIRVCQEEAFPEEIDHLKTGQHLTNRKSILFKCSPYLDEQGILRVRGRIDAIEGVEVSVKRPAILPRHHRVTYLLAEYYHRKYHHQHNEVVVNEMRQRYWIFGLRALVREVAKSCPACKIRRAQPQPPLMGDLPIERLSPHTQPFTYTGVDYFGPIDIAVGRRREKRWGVLFTCLTVRAVYLDIVPSLSTDSFLMVLKQFTARRGVPRRLMSDNGTNFRGASRVLKEEIERISTSQVESKYPEMTFTFIPPGAPHMGGAWERMVRSTKSVLTEILPIGLREDVLRAALADVESTLNSRPLTYVPLTSADDEALTPNHFLVGNSSGLRERGAMQQTGATLAKNFRVASQLADRFWKRWLREYLPTLTRRTKWFQPNPEPIAEGDVVIVVDETSKRNSWPKGVVIEVHKASDGQVRSGVVRTAEGLVTRPAVKLAKLDIGYRQEVGNTQRGRAVELRGGECCVAK